MPVLLEVRHRVKPLTNSAFDAFVGFYADEVFPRMAEHGIDLFGAWKVNGGEMGWDLSLHRYDSMAHAEQCLGSLRRDGDLAKAIERVRGEVAIEEQTKFANTVSYATAERLEAALAEPGEERQYMLAVLQTGTGGALPAIDGIADLVDQVEAAGAMQLVTAYATAIGRTGEITDLWILPHGARGMLRYRAGAGLDAIVAPLREHAPEESLLYLNPLPYSKLK